MTIERLVTVTHSIHISQDAEEELGTRRCTIMLYMGHSLRSKRGLIVSTASLQ